MSNDNDAGTPPEGEQPQQGDDDAGKGGKAAVLADLAKERDGRQQEQARNTALEQQITDLRASNDAFKADMARALGLTKDEEVTTEQLQEQLKQSGAATQSAARELAVFRLAGQHGANAALLTDSTSFLRSIADIDPADADKMSEAIKAAVEANASYRAVPAGRGSRDAGASNPSGGTKTMDDLIRGN